MVKNHKDFIICVERKDNPTGVKMIKLLSE